MHRAALLSSGVALAIGCAVEEAPETRKESQILSAPDAAAGDIYGGAVGISGDFALVAAEWDDDDGKDSGAVWVFKKTDAEWVRTQKLRAPDAAEGDNFGRSIAMHEDVAVIGTHWDDTPQHKNAGSAYVYRRNGSTWELEQKLMAPDGATWDSLGNAVSIEGNWIAVAACRKDLVGKDSGAVYMFRFDGQTWSQTQILKPRLSAAADQFGRGVWISGNALLVGAWLQDSRGADSGAAYVFRERGGTWMEEQKLTPEDGKAGDNFGFSVSLDGDTALVGAHKNAAGQHDSGSAYVFRFDGEHWSQEQKLVAFQPLKNASMGWAVVLQGDLAIVSEHYFYNKVLPRVPGKAFVYERTENQWQLTRQLAPSDGHPGDVFSFHIALDHGTAVLGSWRHHHAGKDSGQAYVFEDL